MNKDQFKSIKRILLIADHITRITLMCSEYCCILNNSEKSLLSAACKKDCQLKSIYRILRYCSESFNKLFYCVK